MGENSYQLQVSTVGVRDKENELLGAEIPSDTLFLRRRDNAPEKWSNTVEREADGCLPACGSRTVMVEGDVVSTVCDATCVNDHPSMGIRFDGHNCGAGDPSKYGESCRLCFKDQRVALLEDIVLAASNGISWASHVHVIMCDTQRPPEAMDCSRICMDGVNTVRIDVS